MRPSSLRSSSVRYAKSTSTTLTMIAALISEIHHGSLMRFRLLRSRKRQVHEPEQAVRVLVGDKCDTRTHIVGEARSQLDRDAACRHGYRIARRDTSRARVSARDGDLGLRPLELELVNALHGGAGEERLEDDGGEARAPRGGPGRAPRWPRPPQRPRGGA